MLLRRPLKITHASMLLVIIAFFAGCNNNTPPTAEQLQARAAGANTLKKAISDYQFFFIIPKKGSPVETADLFRVFQKNGHHIFRLHYYENTNSDQTQIAEDLYRKIYENNGSQCSLCENITPDMIVGGPDPRLLWVQSAYIQDTLTPIVTVNGTTVPVACGSNVATKHSSCKVLP